MRPDDRKPCLTAIEDKAESLNSLYRGWGAAAIIAHAAGEAFPGRIAFVSSFGAESAVLLHLMASADPSIPVLFLDTNKLFGETVRYRSRLQHHLGLEDVRVIGPRKRDLERDDPQGVLSMKDPDECCRLRKAEPLTRALKGFDCWATGRKRHQTEFRKEMETVEHDGSSFKLNPLANWTRADIADYFSAHKLPEHPLVKQGYHSIGCMPCTSKVVDENDARSGRWAGQAKTECGIHSKKK
ncbi:phosphoadenylyl-sulfate reductase [Marinicaulis flavus]|uniref:Adenosine 5'-phosphosulfate reductase n=1 Tax=Hyphococcus luteus TaxID=2058213 RepID=A0A2S7K8M2_9PROT|nr:phosphoadenylyl-sulfate reductase [Marinicaulis flavus]